MRNAELTSGIEVYSDETGEVYGSSQAAAKEAIGLTVISRVVIAAGCLLAPPLATTMMERRKYICGQNMGWRTGSFTVGTVTPVQLHL